MVSVHLQICSFRSFALVFRVNLLELKCIWTNWNDAMRFNSLESISFLALCQSGCMRERFNKKENNHIFFFLVAFHVPTSTVAHECWRAYGVQTKVRKTQKMIHEYQENNGINWKCIFCVVNDFFIHCLLPLSFPSFEMRISHFVLKFS